MAKEMFDQLRYTFGLLHFDYSGEPPNMSDIRRRNTQLSVMDLIKYDRCRLRARYSRGIYESFPDG
jgi:hypothetical protein